MEKKDWHDALLLIPYSVFVLTTRQGEEINACTATWLMQVSFEPPMVAIAVDKNSHSYGLLLKGGTFGVNFLDSVQISLANRLGLPHRFRPQHLAGILHRISEGGTPILQEALAYLECQVRASLDTGGDHTIFVGEVVAGGVEQEGEPMTLKESGLRYR